MPNKKWTKKDEKYLNKKIKKASPQWENIDVDKFMAEVRGRNYTKKKQHYIYVARVYDDGDCAYMHLLCNNKIKVDKNHRYKVIANSKLFDLLETSIFDLKLKKGEQVRIPIDIDKAEVVK